LEELVIIVKLNLEGELYAVAYPGTFFRGGVKKIHLRKEGRENGDLGVVTP
jgi:hypothetical protein